MTEAKTDYIAEAITEQFGERCPDYAEGCVCCEVWEQYDALRSSLSRKTAGEAEPVNIRQTLINCAQIIDVVKGEWEQAGAWSAWDQSVRDDISKTLAALYALRSSLSRKTAGEAELTPMFGFLVFLKDMRFTGSWDLPTLNRAIEVGETIAAQALASPPLPDTEEKGL